MSLSLAFLSFIFASGICVLLISVLTAPHGSEDARGFHAMSPIKQTEMPPVSLPAEFHEVAGRM